MKKNENEKVTITVSSRPNDMRGWFEEKSGRILEELSFLADTLHRPGDAPAGGWPTSIFPRRSRLPWQSPPSPAKGSAPSKRRTLPGSRREAAKDIWNTGRAGSLKRSCSQIVCK